MSPAPEIRLVRRGDASVLQAWTEGGAEVDLAVVADAEVSRLVADHERARDARLAGGVS